MNQSSLQTPASCVQLEQVSIKVLNESQGVPELSNNTREYLNSNNEERQNIKDHKEIFKQEKKIRRPSKHLIIATSVDRNTTYTKDADEVNYLDQSTSHFQKQTQQISPQHEYQQNQDRKFSLLSTNQTNTNGKRQKKELKCRRGWSDLMMMSGRKVIMREKKKPSFNGDPQQLLQEQQEKGLRDSCKNNSCQKSNPNDKFKFIEQNPNNESDSTMPFNNQNFDNDATQKRDENQSPTSSTTTTSQILSNMRQNKQYNNNYDEQQNSQFDQLMREQQTQWSKNIIRYQKQDQKKQRVKQLEDILRESGEQAEGSLNLSSNKKSYKNKYQDSQLQPEYCFCECYSNKSNKQMALSDNSVVNNRYQNQQQPITFARSKVHLPKLDFQERTKREDNSRKQKQIPDADADDDTNHNNTHYHSYNNHLSQLIPEDIRKELWKKDTKLLPKFKLPEQYTQHHKDNQNSHIQDNDLIESQEILSIPQIPSTYSVISFQEVNANNKSQQSMLHEKIRSRQINFEGNKRYRYQQQQLQIDTPINLEVNNSINKSKDDKLMSKTTTNQESKIIMSTKRDQSPHVINNNNNVNDLNRNVSHSNSCQPTKNIKNNGVISVHNSSFPIIISPRFAFQKNQEFVKESVTTMFSPRLVQLNAMSSQDNTLLKQRNEQNSPSPISVAMNALTPKQVVSKINLMDNFKSDNSTKNYSNPLIPYYEQEKFKSGLDVMKIIKRSQYEYESNKIKKHLKSNLLTDLLSSHFSQGINLSQRRQELVHQQQFQQQQQQQQQPQQQPVVDLKPNVDQQLSTKSSNKASTMQNRHKHNKQLKQKQKEDIEKIREDSLQGYEYDDKEEEQNFANTWASFNIQQYVQNKATKI